MIQRKNGKKGFSLIELLAVVVILGIIILITTPVVMGMIKKAQKESCIASGRMAEKAASNYLTLTNNVKLPVENQTVSITIGELVYNDYLTPVLDPATKEPVDYEKSKVDIINEEGNYVYKTTLISPTCSDIEIELPGGEVKNDATYYTGLGPNNWVLFGRIDESSKEGILWRIIKKDEGGLKLVYEGLENSGFHPIEDGRVSLGGTTSIPYSINNETSFENSYIFPLLKEWENNLVIFDREKYLKPAKWKIGLVPNFEPTELDSIYGYETLDTDESDGMSLPSSIGTISLSDYFHTSTDLSCNKTYSEGGSPSCAFSGSTINNFLYKDKYSYWTMNGVLDEKRAWYINNTGQILTGNLGLASISVRPVINLNEKLEFVSGKGTIDSPYILEEYMTTIKNGPIIKLIGEDKVTIRKGEPYVESGAEAFDDEDGDLTENIEVETNLNIDKPGTYKITYSVKDNDGNSAPKVVRTVVVKDLESPIIKLNGSNPMRILVKEPYVEPGATAYDPYYGELENIEITGHVDTEELGRYVIKYRVENEDGKIDEKIRTVIVEAPKPVVTLKGENPSIVYVGQSYVESGAEAYDIYEGDITDKIVRTIKKVVGPLDTKQIVNNIEIVKDNRYQVEYTVLNEYGVAGKAIRNVYILSDEGPIIKFTPNGNNTSSKNHSSEVTVEDNVYPAVTSSYKYTWIKSDFSKPSYYPWSDYIKNSFSSGDTVSIGNKTGLYKIMAMAKDNLGNTRLIGSNYFRLDNSRPEITLNGSSYTKIAITKNYVDPGARAYDMAYDGDLTNKIIRSGTVDTSKTGLNYITYTVTDSSGNKTTRTRTVEVYEPKPTISLNGSSVQKVLVDTSYVELGAKASDELEGNISHKITISGVENIDTSTPGNYSVTYSVTNNYGKTSTVVRTVRVYLPKPSITIKGSKTINHLIGTPYTDQGATATDEKDGNLTENITVTNNVNPNKLGTYTITYRVVNSYGIEAVENRTVKVYALGPSISLNGKANQQIIVGSTWIDEGATATDPYDGDITENIVRTGSVNTNKAGVYKLTYTVTNKYGEKASVTRTVEVKKTEGPTVLFTGTGTSWSYSHTVKAEIIKNYGELVPSSFAYYWQKGASTPSTGSFKSYENNTLLETPSGESGEYYLWIYAKDEFNNETKVRSGVFRIDNEDPNITLKGKSVMEIPIDSTYVDPGVNLKDSHSGINHSSYQVTSNLNTSMFGSYEITYEVEDNLGHKATAKRTVIVVQKSLLSSPGADFEPKYYAQYFTGTNPNNWVVFGNAADNVYDYIPVYYRIVTADDNGIKIVYEGTKSEILNSNKTGSIGKTTYGQTFDYATSNVKTMIDSWYQNINEPDKASYIKNTDWCVGSIPSPYSLDKMKEEECSDKIIGSPVGILTIGDYLSVTKASCSGYLELSCGNQNFLKKNYSYFTGNGDRVNPGYIFVSHSNGAANVVSLNTELDVRPVINLREDILIRGGDGSFENPYTLNTRTPIIDNQAPEITLTPGNYIRNKDEGIEVIVTDDITGVDENSLRYVWTTTDVVPPRETFTEVYENGEKIYQEEDGKKYLHVLAKDRKGNEKVVTKGLYILDREGPNLTIPTNTNILVSEVNEFNTRLNVVVTDDLDSNPTFEVSGNLSTIPGTYTLTYTALDHAGNITVKNRVITVEEESEANQPELSDGMIPIVRNEENTAWIKANPSNNWYDYKTKKWANAVLVTGATRNSYITATPGTVINEADVLAYFVWIPRYRYELFNVDSLSISPQTIKIRYESATTPKSTGTKNGEWLTHPAFTFGNKELSGFWVGKFETTGSSGTPTIKPNSTPLQLSNVRTMFDTSRKFSQTATYGLTPINDSHMMKNIEWGAVAYLSHSIYGKNSEIWRNPNNAARTGCAGGSVNAGPTSGCNQYHTTNGQQASTTGNVYGIYDMSAGSWEILMANLNGTYGSSGFNSSNIPAEKYLDRYTGTTRESQRKLGDAIGETWGWYGDYSTALKSSTPWFIRSAYHSTSTISASGIFAYTGNAGTQHVFRTVILGEKPLVEASPKVDNWSKPLNVTLTVKDLSKLKTNTLRYEWSTNNTLPETISNSFTGTTTISSPNTTGIYYLWISYEEVNGEIQTFMAGEYKIDAVSPVINAPKERYLLTTEVSGYDVKSNVVVTDDMDTSPSLSASGNLSTIPGTYIITYTAVDHVGNSSTTTSKFIVEEESEANHPELSDGMIPIVRNEENTAWVKANPSNNWYDYKTKKWANAVLVTGATRNSYITATPGTVINEADVLAYFVWIPRYSYELFNVEALSISPQTIKIRYESATTPKSTGTKNGEWLTHPAFTFGNKELSGFWVGKFETTGSSGTPTIKPNTTSIRNINTKTMFDTALKFNDTTTYGLTQYNDAHMIKNTEWGAIAYLTQSEYGKNSEVWINPNSNYLTGCAGGSVNAGSTTGCNQYHTANGQQASTTGNVYGVYDMSGGAWEYVMAFMDSSYGSSGFNSGNLPSSKYYDSYEYGTTTNNQVAYDRRNLGDATGEIRSWFGSYANMHYSSSQLLYRGGSHSNGVLSDVFSFSPNNGAANASVTFRTVVLGGQHSVVVYPESNDWGTNPEITLSVDDINNVDLNSLKYTWSKFEEEPDNISTTFTNNTKISLPNENGIHYLWIQYKTIDNDVYRFVRGPYRVMKEESSELPFGNGIVQQLYHSYNSNEVVTLEANGEEYLAEIYYFSENVTYNTTPTLCDDVPDTKMCVLIYEKNLFIGKNVTLTPQTRKKGFTIIVKGVLENHGTISMTARGASAVGQNVYLWENSDETYEFVPEAGAAGGRGFYRSAGGTTPGEAGKSGVNRQTGGGGGGTANYGTGGHGRAGTSYSGGTGGGSGGYDNKVGQAGALNGGRGGDSACSRTSTGGGAGNPGGSGCGGGSAGQSGTGGLLIIFSKTIENRGIIESNGSNGGSGALVGGSSGGGSVNIFYQELITQGTIRALGGGTSSRGPGGDGSVTLTEIE